MKIVLSPDSFKGSLSSERVCFFIEKGLKKSIPKAEIIKIPIADGGEGSLKCLKESLKADYKSVRVVNPIGKKINAFYLVAKDFSVIEMAQASGLTLINDNQKNPFKTTSYGTGQLILNSIKSGIKKIYLCIGGSATVDGGAGMLQALGLHFYDKKNNLIKEYMNNELLSQIKKINTSHFYKNIQGVKIIILSDVKNKLLGKNGSVYVYARQKGAKENDLVLLEANMKYFYNLISKYTKNVINIEGSGAAGGLGAGILSFFDCEIKSGIEEILEIVNFSEKIKNANIIITGEGSIDRQTLNGKVISGILNKSNGIPVIAIAGSVNDIDKINEMGILSAFPICNKPMSLEDSIINVEKLIENISIQIGNLIKLKF
ncbi:MAG: glycerate kinase [Candidatus Sericytochromatia bacterium]